MFERFLRYVQIDTTSSEEHCDQVPSSKKQFDLANVLSKDNALRRQPRKRKRVCYRPRCRGRVAASTLPATLA